jgi:hypothetical protein
MSFTMTGNFVPESLTLTSASLAFPTSDRGSNISIDERIYRALYSYIPLKHIDRRRPLRWRKAHRAFNVSIYDIRAPKFAIVSWTGSQTCHVLSVTRKIF